jgi:hypothetical protein
MNHIEYRVTEIYGRYFDKKWAVQHKYSYYHNGNKIESWHTFFSCTDRDKCIEVMEKHKTQPKKHRVPFDANLWN